MKVEQTRWDGTKTLVRVVEVASLKDLPWERDVDSKVVEDSVPTSDWAEQKVKKNA